MNDYQTLLELISEPTPNYYQLLLLHHKAISNELILRSKKSVSTELGLSQAKFSTAIQLIQAYGQLETTPKAN